METKFHIQYHAKYGRVLIAGLTQTSGTIKIKGKAFTIVKAFPFTTDFLKSREACFKH
ncbi:trp RNA-binding attenuation protein MtrB [Sphingobacterium anhuiense]|uniref:trp RNA-binding attenuation protein MtrB n=1 Tax=Sphingobacterium anhuiense TaxID=493780 RepID=UPI003C2EB2C5